jgi:hypothetical protein
MAFLLAHGARTVQLRLGLVPAPVVRAAVTILVVAFQMRKAWWAPSEWERPWCRAR